MVWYKKNILPSSANPMENKRKIQNATLFGIIFGVSKETMALQPLVWLFIFFKIHQQLVGLTEKFRIEIT